MPENRNDKTQSYSRNPRTTEPRRRNRTEDYGDGFNAPAESAAPPEETDVAFADVPRTQNPARPNGAARGQADSRRSAISDAKRQETKKKNAMIIAVTVAAVVVIVAIVIIFAMKSSKDDSDSEAETTATVSTSETASETESTESEEDEYVTVTDQNAGNDATSDNGGSSDTPTSAPTERAVVTETPTQATVATEAPTQPATEAPATSEDNGSDEDDAIIINDFDVIE